MSRATTARKTASASQKEKEDADRQIAEEQAVLREKQAIEENRRAEEEAISRANDSLAEEQRQQQASNRRRMEADRQAHLERERRIREKERDLQQLHLISEKEQDIKELTKKVYDLHRAAERCRADYEVEKRTRSSLEDQLAASHAKIAQYQQSVTGERQVLLDTSRGLQADNDSLRHVISTLEEDSERAKADLQAATDAAGKTESELKAKLEQERRSYDSRLSENNLALDRLKTKFEKLQATNNDLTRDLTQHERDHVMQSVIISMLKSDVDNANAAAAKDKEVASILEEKLRVAEEQLSKFAAAEAGREAERNGFRESMNAELAAKMEIISELRGQVASLKATLERTEAVAAAAETKASADAEKHAEVEKELWQQNATLKASLDNSKLSLEQSADTLKRKELEMIEKTTALKGEVDSLASRLQHATVSLEKAETTSFQSITALRAEKEQLLHKVSSLEHAIGESQKEAFEKETALRGEVEKLRVNFDAERRLADVKERDYLTGEAAKAAEIQALREAYMREKDDNNRRQTEFVNQQVQLHADKENAKARLVGAEDEVSRLKTLLDKATKDAAVEKDRLGSTHEREVAALTRELTAVTEDRDRIRDVATTASERVAAAESDGQAREKDSWERAVAYKAEIASLQGEVEAHKDTIARLESAVGDSYSSRALEQQNAELRGDIESYRLQVKNLQGMISTMKLETELLDSYKTKVLSDSSEVQQRRLAELEREHRLIGPLIQDMFAILRRNELVTAPLQSAVDAYRAQVVTLANAPAATAVAASGDLAGLPRLSPTVRPGSGNVRVSAV